jgi:hypothetical protein
VGFHVIRVPISAVGVVDEQDVRVLRAQDLREPLRGDFGLGTDESRPVRRIRIQVLAMAAVGVRQALDPRDAQRGRALS